MNAGHHGKISGSWKVRLNRIIEFPNKDEVQRFINEDVVSAMKVVKEELSSYSWNAEIENDKEKAISILRVEHSEDFDFIYEVRTKNYDTPSYAYPESINPTKEQKRYSRVEVYLQDGNKAYDIYGYDHDAIVIDIIDQFEKHRHFLHNTSTLNPVVPID